MPSTEPGVAEGDPTEHAGNPERGAERPTSTEVLAEERPLRGAPPLLQTPSQTVGPFFGYALPFASGPYLVHPAVPGAIRLHGTVRDGEGAPVPDALLELWQPDADGRIVREPGSRRATRTAFTGFGRADVAVPTGTYEFVTLLPGARTAGGPRWAAITVFARGLLHHLFTRAYFVPDGEPEPTDALLEAVEPGRRGSLLARQDGPASYRFDVVLQGEHETVFLEYAAPDYAGLDYTALDHAG